MITIFCTVVLSVIQGIALNTGVLPFSKGRALQEFTHTSQTRHSYNFATTEWSDNRMNPHNLIILAEPYTIRLHWKLSNTGKT